MLMMILPAIQELPYFPLALEHWPEHKYGRVPVPTESTVHLNCEMSFC